MNRNTIADISTYATLLPFISGLIVFRKSGVVYRLFTLFLLYGFLTDFFVGYFWRSQMMSQSQTIFFIYLLIEAMFTAWFISHLSDYALLTKTAFLLLIILPLFWAMEHIDFTTFEWLEVPHSNTFETATKMVISILSSWTILRLTQKETDLINMPEFWFLSGIFFYNFCTFFISVFMQSPELRKYWFLHNFLNIMTYFIYAYGYLKIETTRKLKVKS